jgi:hypothetical protein
VNPLNQKYPRADPLPKAHLPDFLVKVKELASQLDSVSVASATGGSGRAPQAAP